MVPYFKIDKSDVVYSKQVEIDPKLVKHDIIILSMCGVLSDNILKISSFIDHVENIDLSLAEKLYLKRTRRILNSNIEYTKLYVSNEMQRIYPKDDDSSEHSTSGNTLIRPIEVVIIRGSNDIAPNQLSININSIIGNNNTITYVGNPTILISNERELVKKWINSNPPAQNEFSTDYYARLKIGIANQVKYIKLGNNFLHSIISSCGFKTHKYNNRAAWIK